MATIAQLKAQLAALQKQIKPYTGSDSRVMQQRWAARQSELKHQAAIVAQRIYMAQVGALPIARRSDAQLGSELGKLVSLRSQSNTDGGSMTRAKAKAAAQIYAAAGGDARTKIVTVEMDRRGILQPWLDAHQSASLWVSVFRPVLKAGAVAAAVYYGAGLLGNNAAAATTAGEGATLADTYAAMNSAAGITTSGSAAADVALASAVQTGTMTVEAANAYTAAIAAGTVSEAAVVEGLASMQGANLAAAVPTVSTAAPINNEVLKTGVDMATVTAQPTGMDAVFASIGDAAQTAINAAGTAAANKILGGNDPVQAQAAAQSQTQNANTGMLVVGGIAAILLIAFMMRAG